MSYPHRPPPSLKLIAPASAADPALLEAARGGDDQAFARLVEPFRSELSAHCYRMLGSAHDAEDALQEAMLRAWRGLPKFEGRSSLRSWLYTISTNTCLNLIERRPKRVLPIDYDGTADPHDGLGLPPLESVWVEPFPDAGLALEDGYAAPEARYELRESVELAFVAALQNLPANQRAVLILREVLGFSAAEVADALDTSVASVNSALQRARKTVDEKLPDESQQATLRSLDDDELRQIVESYMDAMERGDVEAVMDLLAEDAVWSMPPLPAWFTGREGLRTFMRNGPLSGDWRWKHIPTQANGQPAVASYAWYEPDQAYRLFAIDVFTLAGSKIKAITSFINRSTMSREELFYQRYPEQPVDDSNTSVPAEAFGLPELID
jgi:RNA polymerase sigma-70 factor, ECF subfamily